MLAKLGGLYTTDIKPFEFNLKTKTKFGEGISENLGEYLKEFKLSRVGLIVDSAVYDNPEIKKIIEKINKSSFKNVKIWKYDLKGEPDYDTLDIVKKEFLDENNNPTVDCFVGIGGGSVIDFSKGMSTLVVNPGNSRDYRGFPKDINPSLPTIAIPTVAGTAAEVTYNAVFNDKKIKKKLGINTFNNFPVLSILDPTLTATCPVSVTISTGMDAMVHALESYVTNNSNLITKMHAKNAFGLLYNNLLKIKEKPNDISIRSNLLFGSYLAGISLMNSGAGPASGLQYILGAQYEIPHGIAGAVFIPYVVKHNAENGVDYSELYDQIEEIDTCKTKEEKIREFPEKIFELCRTLDIPENLSHFGVTKQNADDLIKRVEELEGMFVQNPVKFTIEDGKNIVKNLI